MPFPPSMTQQGTFARFMPDTPLAVRPWVRLRVCNDSVTQAEDPSADTQRRPWPADTDRCGGDGENPATSLHEEPTPAQCLPSPANQPRRSQAELADEWLRELGLNAARPTNSTAEEAESDSAPAPPVPRQPPDDSSSDAGQAEPAATDPVAESDLRAPSHREAPSNRAADGAGESPVEREAPIEDQVEDAAEPALRGMAAPAQLLPRCRRRCPMYTPSRRRPWVS